VLNGELFVFGGAYNGETNYAKQVIEVPVLINLTYI